jgi:hypothetical protein
MNIIVHIAVSRHGFIVAQFADFEDCIAFCANSDMTPISVYRVKCPLVGARYEVEA